MLSAFFMLLANHLWQSTLFVLAAALLAAALKKNQPRTRYWVWWIASLKFLIPFSLLVSVGSQFSWRTASAIPDEPSVSAVVFEQVAQPFTSGTVWTSVSTETATPPDASVAVVPIVVFAAWFCGCGLMFLRWWSKWRRARTLAGQTRRAAFLTEGREVDTLRRLERRVGVRRPLAIAASAAAIEPSVFGLFRPVLVWPAGLSARLEDEEIESILLHELSHGHRRDNLTSALHMVVEALFWFHPLIWWIGVRLVDERERACDENVLRWGGTSKVYAEGILKVCEFCLESPMVCAAGVTGSDLKRRIEDIMRNRLAPQLSLSRAVLLAAAAITAFAAPIAIGILQAGEREARSGAAIAAESRTPRAAVHPGILEERPATIETAPVQDRSQALQIAAQNLAQRSPDLVGEIRRILAPVAQDSFEVISIRPSTAASAGGRGGGPGTRGQPPNTPAACGGVIQVNPGRFVATNVTLYRLITLAYGKHCRLSTEQDLVTGGPDWTQSVAFDIQATIPAGAPGYTQQQLANGEAPKLQMMIQNLLADRFKLALHRDTKEIPIYNLVLVRMGRIKLSEDQTPPAPLAPPTGPPVPRDPSAPPPRGAFGVGVDPPAGKVRIFASAIPISTMINFYQGGVGRLVVDKTELKGLFDIPDVTLDVGPYDISPGAVTVWPEIMQQLGLRMDPTRGPAEVLVIDRVERPSEN